MAPSQPIQAMDVTSLRAVVTELQPHILPSRFEKAQQPDAQTVQLALRGLEGTTWLSLSWQAEAPRLLAISHPPVQGEGSTMAQQLRHGLKGLALVSLEQHGYERVVELIFAQRPGEPPLRFLVLELMGRHSNLFLLDERRQVVTLARQVGKGLSRLRPIATGDSYRSPPPMAGDVPCANQGQAAWRRRLVLLPLPLSRALMEAYQGIGPALARQLCHGVDIDPLTGCTIETLPVREIREIQWNQLWDRWQRWLGVWEQQSFTLAWGGPSDFRCWDGPPLAPNVGALPINRGLASYYCDRLAKRRLQQRRHALTQTLQSAAGREERGIQRQELLLAAVPGGEGLQRRAHALLSKPNPSRQQIDEAQTLYRQARKLRRSSAAITPRLELHQQRLQWLNASLTYLEQADSQEQLEVLAEELGDLLGSSSAGRRDGISSQQGRGRRQTAAQAPPRPLELRTDGGLRLQVGRNHRQNEWISLRQARRGDLWFHAQECPGSHVVLKASEGLPQDNDLATAADLAAHFSRGRGNRRVPVVMVPIEDLQRIPGAGPGTVRHRGGTLLWGEPERALLRLPPSSLLAQDRP